MLTAYPAISDIVMVDFLESLCKISDFFLNSSVDLLFKRNGSVSTQGFPLNPNKKWAMYQTSLTLSVAG